MPTAKLFLPATALALAAACGRPDHTASDTAVRAAGTSAAAQTTPAPTLTTAAAETAKTSPTATQSGSAKTTAEPQSVGPRATAAAADTAIAHPAVAAPGRDTAPAAKPAAAPAPAPAPTAATPAPAPAATASAVSDSSGRPAYDANCRRCHGVRGVPPRTMAAKYPKIPTFDAAFVAKMSADSIVSVLNRGVNDDMKSFKDKLTRDEMRAVAAYLRAFAK